MTKPFVNLSEVEFTDIEENGFYTSKRAHFSAAIGARKLGYKPTCDARPLRSGERNAGIAVPWLHTSVRYSCGRDTLRRNHVLNLPPGAG